MKRTDAVNRINSLSGETGHKWVVDTYNSIQPRPRGYKLQSKDPWCAATISAVLHSIGYDDLAECSCPVMIQKAKERGVWKEDDAFRPQVGDILMYDWQDTGKGDNIGVADHVGMVVKINGDTLTVREGNKNKTVGNRSVKVNSKTIRGFITPPYSEESAESANTAPKEEKPADKPKNEVKQSDYVVGETYTVNVRSALNVRKGAGKNFGLVGYARLTANAKKHATAGGALVNGTRVDCLEVQNVGNETWIRIPSGWICAKSGDAKYVK